MTESVSSSVAAPEPPLCRICGAAPADSDEHYIPKALGNRSAVRLLVQEPDGSQRERRCSDGFFVRTLCGRCNNKPASTYAQAYITLYRQIQTAPDIRGTDGHLLVHCRRIHPLRVIKQAILAFLCASPWYPAPVWRPLQQCLRDRETPLPPSAPRVFLYFNTSCFGRIVPSCGMLELANHRTTLLSEISWPPLGIVLAFGDLPIPEVMHEITSWGLEPYAKAVATDLSLPRLRVNTLYPLAFGSSRTIERAQERTLPVFLHHVPPGSTSPTNLAALIRRV